MKIGPFCIGVKYLESHSHGEEKFINPVRVWPGHGWNVWFYAWQEAVVFYFYRLLILAGLIGTLTVTATIIPTDRRATWQGNVGVVGGIPNYTNIFTTIYPSDDLTGATDWSNIQNAVHTATNGSVVLLANGQFYINDVIDFAGQPNGMVLRGNGPKSTKIKLTTFPARFYMRYSSFDEDAMSVQTNLLQDAVKGASTIRLATVPSWISPGALVAIDQVDDESLATDFGQEGNSTYRKILGHESHVIDYFNADVSNWTPDAHATVTWFSDTPPSEAGQSVPGVMKFVTDFTSSSSLQTASATYTLPALLNMALDYTRIYVYYRIDSGSSLTTASDYGNLKFIFKNGAGLTAEPGESAVLESRATAGWLGRNLGTLAFTNNATDVRAITVQVSGTNFTGPVTVYIDAIKLIGGRGLMNVLKVATVTTTNFTTELPLFFGFKTNRHAQVFQAGHNPAITRPLRNCGIEDLTIEGDYSATGVDNIVMEVCDGCWLKNVHSLNTPGRSLITYAVFSYRCEVRDSFGELSHNYGAGQAYGVALYHGCVGFLVENNILKNFHVGLSVDYGSAGNVLAYNYILSPQADQPQAPSLNTHGTHTSMNLFEGNWTETKMLADVTHGSSSDNTVFRNRIQGYNFGRLFDQVPVSLEMWNREWNIVGNVLGIPSFHTNYTIGPDPSYTVNDTNTFDPGTKSIFQLGYFINYGGSMLYGSASAVTMNVLIHGNWDAAHDSITWDGAIADHVLPSSLYLTAKPSWWDDGAAYPPVEPTTTTSVNINAITIPAKLRYERDWVPQVYTKIRALGNPVGGQL